MNRREPMNFKKIDMLQSTISQLGKTLCGNENATLHECLQAADQLKARLAQVERERDVAVAVLWRAGTCDGCIYDNAIPIPDACICCVRISPNDPDGKLDNWKWRGVCQKNTKEAAPS